MNPIDVSNNELRPSDLHGILRYVKSFRAKPSLSALIIH